MTAAPATVPLCRACLVIPGRQVPATHASQYSDRMTWCSDHALSGDPALEPPDCGPCSGAECTRCPLPTDAQIDESNARAAERRGLVRLVVVLTEPASELWPGLGEPEGIER